MSEPYQIGRYYRVPMVRGKLFSITADWPVLGPLHADPDIGAAFDHFHVDARFLSDRLWKLFGQTRGIHDVYVYPLHGPIGGEDDTRPQLQPLGLRRRKCRRHYPPYPHLVARWQNTLHREFSNRTLGENLVCPHRGASLRGLEPINGCVTCPLHGLRWNLQTRRLCPANSATKAG